MDLSSADCVGPTSSGRVRLFPAGNDYPDNDYRASEIEQAAGPRITTNRVGRMKQISGTVMIAGRRAAFSSARIMRSLRNSADSTRSAEASGVPYFSVW